MYSFAFSVGYVGTAYHGWQYQHGLSTVQGKLSEALSQIADQPVTVLAAGRTDRGVHATAQVAGFSTQVDREPAVWLRGINGLTPADIHVNWLRVVPSTFHARYSAVARQYTYLFRDGPGADIFTHDRAWQVADPLDADLMHRAAQRLVGEHDFSSFRAAGCQSLTPIRRVNFCTVTRRGDLVVMTIEANAFVLHMVRNIAQGLVQASQQGNDEYISDLLLQRNRTQLGPTAPPGGLYFTDVSYPEQNFPSGSKPTVVSLARDG